MREREKRERGGVGEYILTFDGIPHPEFQLIKTLKKSHCSGNNVIFDKIAYFNRNILQIIFLKYSPLGFQRDCKAYSPEADYFEQLMTRRKIFTCSPRLGFASLTPPRDCASPLPITQAAFLRLYMPMGC